MAKRSNEKPATVATPLGQLNGRTIRQERFLAAFVEVGYIAAAARAAGVNRTDHWDWLKDDPTYPERFANAQAEAKELLEAEARRRAKDGVQKYVTYQGEVVMVPVFDEDGNPITEPDPETGEPRMKRIPLVEHQYSDNLTMFLLKSLDPEKYRDNAKVEHTGPGGAPLEVTLKFVKPTKA